MHLINWLQIVQVLVVLREGTASLHSNLYVDLGNTIELKCPCQLHCTEITWFVPTKIAPISKGGTVYSQSGSSRYSISGNFTAGEYNLIITDVKPGDQGVYKCSFSTNGTVFQHDVRLYLKKPPTNLKITNVIIGHQLCVTEGDIIDLECTIVSGVPQETLMLVQNGFVLNTSTSGSVKYRFTANAEENNDQYSCKAISEALDSPIKETFTLNVKYHPRVSFANNTAMVIEGHSVMLQCYIDSNPVATNIIWERSSNTQSYIIENDSILHLKRIKREDAGFYSCKATNEIDIGRNEIEIIVLWPPDQPLNFTVSENESGVIVYWIPSFNSELPQTFTIQYRKVNSQIWKSKEFNNKSTIANEGRHFFNIDYLSRGTSYRFRMFAENRGGVSNMTDEQILYIKGNTSLSYIVGAVSACCALIILSTFICCIKICYKSSKYSATYEEPSTVHNIEVEHYEMIDENSNENLTEEVVGFESHYEDPTVEGTAGSYPLIEGFATGNISNDIIGNVYEQVSKNEYDNLSLPYDKLSIKRSK